jgi:hypothetical protein
LRGTSALLLLHCPETLSHARDFNPDTLAHTISRLAREGDFGRSANDTVKTRDSGSSDQSLRGYVTCNGSFHGLTIKATLLPQVKVVASTHSLLHCSKAQNSYISLCRYSILLLSWESVEEILIYTSTKGILTIPPI